MLRQQSIVNSYSSPILRANRFPPFPLVTFPSIPLPTLFLIDGNSLLHRCFYALPTTLKTPDGEIVNAVYGFANILLNIIFKEKPDYIGVAFDRAAPTIRHQEFKDYKATRAKAPDELYAQLPRLKELLASFPVTVVEKDGFEADDLIATMAEQNKRSKKVTIFTGDRDMFQLIDDQVTVAVPKKGWQDVVRYGRLQLKQNYHLTPSQITDFKGLCGDASDNIPGVTGIGEKTAVSLLTDYHSLDNIYLNLDKISPKVQEKLKKDKNQAFFSRKLATLERHVPVEYDLSHCQTKNFNYLNIDNFFNKLHFPSLQRRLQAFLQKSNQLSENESTKDKLKKPTQASLF